MDMAISGQPATLNLIAVSPSFVKLPGDVALNENFVLTGWMTMSKEEQQKVIAKTETAGTRSRAAFFGDDAFSALVDFLAKGDAPVYLGWGSMIAVSPEHMARLAVGALAVTQKRGIILGGWAKLKQ